MPMFVSRRAPRDARRKRDRGLRRPGVRLQSQQEERDRSRKNDASLVTRVRHLNASLRGGRSMILGAFALAAYSWTVCVLLKKFMLSSWLLSSTSRVVGQAKRFAREIADGIKWTSGIVEQLALKGLRQQIEEMAPRVRQVMKQTRARVFGGDTHVEGKLLSLFEPSTEIIRKGKAAKPNEFGKMVKLQEAENQIVVDYEVYDRRPNDADLLIPAIETHQARLGRPPYLVAADAAFYSGKNEAAAKAKGVKRVCVPNRSTKSSERLARLHSHRNGKDTAEGCVGTKLDGRRATSDRPA